MVVGSIFAENTDELFSSFERQTALVLQQDSTLGSDLADVVAVVALNIDVRVDLLKAFLGNVVTVSFGS